MSSICLRRASGSVEPVGFWCSGIVYRYFGFFPWAVSFVRAGPTAFYEMVVFIVILGAGLAYAWKKGVLQWK